MTNYDRLIDELEKLKNLYRSLGEQDQQKLEQAVIMLITKFSQRVK